MLFSGSKDSSILAHDTKIQNNVVMKLDGHRGEVCGLKYDSCGLASGGNDNIVRIWDINMGRSRFTL
jgi:cell division cycle 20-like protein 1 (cofactor of APC complex)